MVAKNKIFLLVSIFIAGTGLVWLWQNKQTELLLPQTEVKFEQPLPQPTPETEPKPITLPAAFQLKVPFTPQAPTANWDELHNQACEEASLIMAQAYYGDTTSLPPATVETEITKLTKWQQTNFGYYLSITTEEVAQMAKEVYGLSAEIVNIDERAIKEALLDNKLVILPAQGQLLDNPNFRAPGPPYHMLVITGWDDHGFITNDPGTRKGLNYPYNYDTLEAASGSWNHAAQSVDTTDKRVIIVSN